MVIGTTREAVESGKKKCVGTPSLWVRRDTLFDISTTLL
jgi:hypothetical protein